MSNSNPGLKYNDTPTAAQWNKFFTGKQDWNAVLDAVIAAGGAPAPGAVVAETARAMAAEAVNATAISTETTRATTAEGTLTTAAAAAATTANAALPKAGGTMTGPIVLSADPAAALQPATKQYVDAANAANTDNVGRNLLANAEFMIQQRGTGAFTTNGAYTADRWVQSLSTSTCSTTIVALADADRTAAGDEAARFALQSVVGGTAGAGDFVVVDQMIESVQRTGARSLEVSFYAKAASGTPKIGVGALQHFGSGGSPSADVNITAIPVTISTTLTRYSVTLALPTTIGKTLGTTAGTDFTKVRFWYSSGATNNTIAGGIGVQSATFSLWGAQAEIGTSATALEKKGISGQFVDCQRFYRVYSTSHYVNTLTTGSQNNYSEQIQPPMRAIPTAAILSNSSINASSFALTPNAQSVTVSYTCTSTGDIQITASFSISADF